MEHGQSGWLLEQKVRVVRPTQYPPRDSQDRHLSAPQAARSSDFACTDAHRARLPVCPVCEAREQGEKATPTRARVSRLRLAAHSILLLLEGNIRKCRP